AALSTAAGEVADRLRDYLAAHPSRAGLTEAQLLAQAEAAGKAELVPPPYTPIYPDNTIRVEPVDVSDLVELLGSTEAVTCRHTLLAAGVPTVSTSVAWLAQRGDSAAARVELTVTALTAHATTYPLGFGPGQQSYVSHLEDFLLYSDQDGRLRRGFETHWARHGEAVTALVSRIVKGNNPSPVAAAWRNWSADVWSTTDQVYQRGGLPTAPGESYTRRARQVGDPATARRWDPELRTEYSEFHRMFNQIDYSRIGRQREFTVYRFTTNVLYLLLSLCDVQPIERYLAAYLVGRAAERVTGLTWQQRIERYLAAQAAETERVSLT
ncbi:MAG TPA: hypothetical protein VKZ67_08880, partial [Natronosporangium sp.]|nr:hypothetical protein [Natronosporangium sp.]